MFLNILSAIAEFERELIKERVCAGVAESMRARKDGKQRHSRSGRDLPHGRPVRIFRRDRAVELRAASWSWRAIARELDVPVSTVRRAVAEATPPKRVG